MPSSQERGGAPLRAAPPALALALLLLSCPHPSGAQQYNSVASPGYRYCTNLFETTDGALRHTGFIPWTVRSPEALPERGPIPIHRQLTFSRADQGVRRPRPRSPQVACSSGVIYVEGAMVGPARCNGDSTAPTLSQEGACGANSAFGAYAATLQRALAAACGGGQSCDFQAAASSARPYPLPS